MGSRIRALILIGLVLASALGVVGCGTSEVPRGDDKPPHDRPGTPAPPSSN